MTMPKARARRHAHLNLKQLVREAQEIAVFFREAASLAGEVSAIHLTKSALSPLGLHDIGYTISRSGEEQRQPSTDLSQDCFCRPGTLTHSAAPCFYCACST